MLKKILYVLVAIVLGFVVFYISWRQSVSSAIVHRGNKALEEENYEFFLKFFEKYDKEEIFCETYTLDNNTTTIRSYNVFSTKVVTDPQNKKNYESRSGIAFFIEKLNLDVVALDEDEPAEDLTDEDPATRITFTADNGETYTSVLSTYGYDATPIVIFNYFTSEFKDYFTKNTSVEPTKITHIKLVDSKNTVFFDNNLSLSFEEHNDEAYWDQLVAEGKGGVAYTSSEYRKNFSFAFPEMRRVFIITSVAILILIGLGIFVFWPKKSYVPTKEDEDRDKYTFASTDEKEKYALAKIARDKKEKEDRENRYKNVRTEKKLDEMTDEALIDSLDKENTAEAAIQQDLEAEAEEKVVEDELDIETETNEDTKEEE